MFLFRERRLTITEMYLPIGNLWDRKTPGRTVYESSISSTASKKNTRVSAVLTSDEETPVEDKSAVRVSGSIDDHLTSLAFTVCII